jgi:two-component system, OmpR family, response regulator
MELEMRILMVEDDPETAAFVQEKLAAIGHQVEVACSVADGLAFGADGSYGLCVVDRMMPDGDGLDVVASLRARGDDTPALVLTAMGAIEDRVSGLQSGADDYLIKPFAIAELCARVEALARRARGREPVMITAGDLELDRLQRTVSRSGEPIELQPREFRLLELLLLNADRVVTRAMMLKGVWALPFDPGTNIVETHISRLRARLDRAGFAPLIQTIRGVGYVIRTN